MNWLIIVAGGSGSRIKKSINKIFIKICGFPILYWTLKTFQDCITIDKIVISAKKEEHNQIQKIVNKYHFSKVIGLSLSGEFRQNTVFNGIKFIKNKCHSNDLIGVHNAVNPFVSNDEIKLVFKSAKKFKAAILAYIPSDTIKIVDQNNFVIQSPSRQFCYSAQTPQVVIFKHLYNSYQKVFSQNLITTDDSQVLELNGFRPKIIPCSVDNFKITYPKDIIVAKQMLKSKLKL
jgi:2-C-methyl-D-erythritol 4-phosphate cytidylyltransferase